MTIVRPKARILRFALGSDEQRASPLWRMWVQGDETYLGVRSALGLAKVSLHSSGHWVYTIGQSALRLPPAQPKSGWRLTLSLRFPGVAAQQPLPHSAEATGKEIMFFPPPPSGYWRVCCVFLASDTTRDTETIGTLPGGAVLVGPLRFRSGGGAYLASFTRQMTSEEVEYIVAERAKFEVNITGPADSFSAATAVLVHDAQEGGAVLMIIDLGKENFRTVPPQAGSRRGREHDGG